MRITEALKPVTDMLAAVGMSLDTATYKDGKLHVTLNTEAPKATGKPGSGPEFPPEGYRLLEKAEVFPILYGASGRLDLRVWIQGRTEWISESLIRKFTYLSSLPVLAVAVPIIPKPEPVKLSDQEKIVGWRGPNGFRMQTFHSREVECAVCKKTIKAGERLARWRSRFPEAFDGFTPGRNTDDDHSHAHVDCLYKSRNHSRSGVQAALLGLDFHLSDVPRWLFTKWEKYDAQQYTP